MDPIGTTSTSKRIGYLTHDEHINDTDAKIQKVVIPELNINLEQMSLNDGEYVIPYFTPRGSYQTPRRAFSESELKTILDENKEECTLSNYMFTMTSADKLGQYLKSNDCTLTSLNFINCGLDDVAFALICKGIECNKSLNTLHLEGFPCHLQLCKHVKTMLGNPKCRLQTINFVNVTISTPSFSEIVLGVISQNNSPNGITTLCFEGCRFNKRYSEQLELLITKSTKLKSLILQGNLLGGRELLPIKKRHHHLMVSETQADSKPSKAIQAIANGLQVNTTLNNLVLASNRISLTDYRKLIEVLKNSNKTVTINLTGNSLDSQRDSARLFTRGHSPRSIAWVNHEEVTPRIKVTPPNLRRKHVLFNK